VLLFQCHYGGERPSSQKPHQCCCFNAFTGCERPSSLHTQQGCCFDAFQVKNVQAHYNKTHRVTVSTPYGGEHQTLTIFVYNTKTYCKHFHCTTYTIVWLYMYISHLFVYNKQICFSFYLVILTWYLWHGCCKERAIPQDDHVCSFNSPHVTLTVFTPSAQ